MISLLQTEDQGDIEGIFEYLTESGSEFENSINDDDDQPDSNSTANVESAIAKYMKENASTLVEDYINDDDQASDSISTVEFLNGDEDQSDEHLNEPMNDEDENVN